MQKQTVIPFFLQYTINALLINSSNIKQDLEIVPRLCLTKKLHSSQTVLTAWLLIEHNAVYQLFHQTGSFNAELPTSVRISHC